MKKYQVNLIGHLDIFIADHEDEFEAKNKSGKMY
jgi:hypothetical protein